MAYMLTAWLGPRLGGRYANYSMNTTDDAARQRAYVQSLLADTDTVDREPERVQWLQASLNKILGTHLAVDGDYSPATFEAVQAFQRQYGLEVDGLAGTSTIQKMRELQDKIPTDSKPLDPESRPAVVATYPARSLCCVNFSGDRPHLPIHASRRLSPFPCRCTGQPATHRRCRYTADD